jgi:hypothetical protein
MNNTNTSSEPLPAAAGDTKITAESLQVLMKEYDTMKDLFSETQVSIQGIFNFYITLVTAVIGGIVLISQISSPESSDKMRSQIIVCGLLILASIIGTIYLLAIVERYSRLIEYGQNLDALRLHLIQKLDVPMPLIYSKFLAQTKKQTLLLEKKSISWLVWFFPTGSYQLAIAFINSCAFVIATWIFLSFSGATNVRFYDSLKMILVEFFIVFNVYNIYSQMALHKWSAIHGLHINPQAESPFQMIR